MQRPKFVMPECFYRASRSSRSPIKTFGDDKIFLVVLFILFFVGCQTTQSKPVSSTSEAISALGTVTEGLTNQNIDAKTLKNLAVQVEKDPQTKTAVESINQALGAQQTGIKYCPVDGQRFDASVEDCPVHQVKLNIVE